LSSPCIPPLILCITCLVPALYPLLSCIPCLGSAPQYILCACSVHSFLVCITSTSIPASLRCTCFVIARQILSTPCRHSGQTPHRPRWTLRPTDRNTRASCTCTSRLSSSPPPMYVSLDDPHQQQHVQLTFCATCLRSSSVHSAASTMLLQVDRRELLAFSGLSVASLSSS
jgi:hypothetical protein